MAMDHQGSSKGSTLTGCVSSSPDANGNYTLSNSQHKTGVAIGPADKVKEHAGHQVSLTGKWTTASAAGTEAAAGKEKGSRMFEVDNVKHISDTCSTAPGGGWHDLRGGAWSVEGALDVLGLGDRDEPLQPEAYPDALARAWSALRRRHPADLLYG